MTTLTKTTLRMLCVKVFNGRADIMEEAQKLLETYEDPATPDDVRELVKTKLDRKIQEIENRVTTRRLKEAKKNDNVPEPPVS